MRNLLLTFGAILMSGIGSAQTDTTHTTKTTTAKKTESVIKKKEGRADKKVTRTNTTQTKDTINRSTNPARKPKEVTPEPATPKVQDPIRNE